MTLVFKKGVKALSVPAVLRILPSFGFFRKALRRCPLDTYPLTYAKVSLKTTQSPKQIASQRQPITFQM